MAQTEIALDDRGESKAMQIRRYPTLQWEGKPGQPVFSSAYGFGKIERRPDLDDDERKELIKKEAEKRRGKEPSHHETLWSIRIKLPAGIVALCRKRYKRKGKSAKNFWRLAAYRFVGLDPPQKHRKSHRHGEST
jgi:hypothetical protein